MKWVIDNGKKSSLRYSYDLDRKILKLFQSENFEKFILP